MADKLIPDVLARRDRNIKNALALYNRLRKKNVTVIKQIGFGGCGIVFTVQENGREPYVMKAVDTAITSMNAPNDEMIHYTELEIDALAKCKSCKYVLDVIDAFDFVVDSATNEHVYLMFMPLLVPSDKYFDVPENRNVAKVVEMLKDICRALSFVHKQGILHRDIKEVNIYWDPYKECFILADFGAARTKIKPGSVVTQIGTEPYMAPEILAGLPLMGRFNADIYSLAATAISLLCNTHKKTPEVLRQIKPDSLRDVIMIAIDYDPSHRFQTADQFLEALENIKFASNSISKEDVIAICMLALMKGDYNIAKMIAAENADNNAMFASVLAFILFKERKQREALSVLNKWRQSGNAIAGGLYGIINLSIAASPEQKKAGFKDVVGSANAGFAPAQYMLGRMLIKGEPEMGIKKDQSTGLNYLFKAISGGYRPAMFYFIKHFNKFKTDMSDMQAFVELMKEDMKNYEKKDFPLDMIFSIFGVTAADINEWMNS